jgi:hypothetical protein
MRPGKRGRRAGPFVVGSCTLVPMSMPSKLRNERTASLDDIRQGRHLQKHTAFVELPEVVTSVVCIKKTLH